MQRLAALILFAFCSAAAAGPSVVGFTGDYAPANWTQDPGDGSVDLFDASTLRLTGGDTQSGLPSSTNVVITVPVTQSVISFDWSFSTLDFDASTDPFGVVFGIITNSFTPIVDWSSGSPQGQSGSYTVSVPLNAGDIFAFSQTTTDNLFGAATTEITNFRVVTVAAVADPLPEPASIALVAAALAALWFVRERAFRRDLA